MNSSSVSVLCQTGYQFQQAGELSEALSRYQEALSLEPACVEAFNGIAQVYQVQGKLPEAIAVCQQALKLQPDFAEAYKTLGNVLQLQGKLEAALRTYQKAVELKPNFAEVEANLGTVFYKLGRLDEAISCYRKAIALKPSLAGVYWNLGNILHSQGNVSEANVYLQKAVQMQPELAGPDFVFTRGNALAAAGDFQEAIRYFRSAVKLNPNWPEASTNLGFAILCEGQRKDEFTRSNFLEAFNSLLKAIELNPNLMFAHLTLYGLLMVTVSESAEFAFLRSLAQQYVERCGEVGKVIAQTALMLTNLNSGLTEVAKETMVRLEANFVEKGESLTGEEMTILYGGLIFGSLSLRDGLLQNSRVFKSVGSFYGRFIEEKIATKKTADGVSLMGSDEVWLMSGEATEELNRPQQKLKVGFLSKHFCRHSVGWCCLNVLQEFSKLAEVYLYVPGGLKGDDQTEKFKQLAHQYYESDKNTLMAAGEVDEEILQKILRDELDVLVDLDSLTVRGHAEIMYRKPAPVCVSWLGFEPPFMLNENYFLCDGFTHPAGVEEYYTEQLVRMPDVWVAVSGFKSTRINGEAIRKSLRVGVDQVVYLSVAPAHKLNREMIEAQIKIIKQVPESVLVQKGVGDAEVIRGLYKEVCEAEGVGFHRLKFVDMAKSEEEHRDIYKCADVVLDSFPYNGGTHNLEALWFNVPVVTRKGEGGMSRMGYSLLKNLGVESGIAESWDEYVEWGVKFGKDASLRNSVREQLRKSKQADSLAPVWNAQKFAVDLLAIFEGLLAKE